MCVGFLLTVLIIGAFVCVFISTYTFINTDKYKHT